MKSYEKKKKELASKGTGKLFSHVSKHTNEGMLKRGLEGMKKASK